MAYDLLKHKVTVIGLIGFFWNIIYSTFYSALKMENGN